MRLAGEAGLFTAAHASAERSCGRLRSCQDESIDHDLNEAPSLLITADDATGALESAARIADEGWVATVVPHSIAVPDPAPGAARSGVVVDLRSRHETPDIAAGRMFAVLRGAPSPVRVHKIDSTLRGNWPAEVIAATRAGRRVVVMPAYPAAGRICRGGVVTEHGVPVDRSDHADDLARRCSPVAPPRCCPTPSNWSTADQVAGWLQARHGVVAVADAADDRELSAVVQRVCSYDDVLLVGTAAVVGAAARHLAPSGLNGPRATAAPAGGAGAGGVRQLASGQPQPGRGTGPRRGGLDRLVVGHRRVTVGFGARVGAVVVGAARRRSGGGRRLVGRSGSSADPVDGRAHGGAAGRRHRRGVHRRPRRARCGFARCRGRASVRSNVDEVALTLVAKPGAFGSTNTLVGSDGRCADRTWLMNRARSA